MDPGQGCVVIAVNVWHSATHLLLEGRFGRTNTIAK